MVNNNKTTHKRRNGLPWTRGESGCRLAVSVWTSERCEKEQNSQVNSSFSMSLFAGLFVVFVLRRDVPGVGVSCFRASVFPCFNHLIFFFSRVFVLNHVPKSSNN